MSDLTRLIIAWLGGFLCGIGLLLMLAQCVVEAKKPTAVVKTAMMEGK